MKVLLAPFTLLAFFVVVPGFTRAEGKHELLLGTEKEDIPATEEQKARCAVSQERRGNTTVTGSTL